MLAYILNSLRSRWLELAIGAVVIAGAVTVLILQQAVSTSAETSVHDLAHKLGRNMLVLPRSLAVSRFYAMDYGDTTMPEDRPGKIRSSDLAQHISLISARLYGNITVKGAELVLVGRRDLGRRGRNNGVGAGEAMLGKTAARQLGLEVGDKLVLVRSQTTLRVAKIIDPPPDGIDVGVFTSLTVAQRVLERPGAINAMRLGGCWCRLDVATLAGKVERLLPGSRAITIAGMLKAQKGTIASVKRYSTILKGSSLGVVALMVALLIGSQIRRQRREIALLLAMGATPWRVSSLFVAQATVMALLGVGLGLLLIPQATELLLPASLRLAPTAAGPEWSLVLLVTAVSAAAAYLPARRATRVDPTAVLSEV